MLNTSNPYSLCFNPFSTTIKDIDGEDRFLVSTCYWSHGWPDGHFETMVFGYKTESEELERYRCDDHYEALTAHLAFVKQYSDYLLDIRYREITE